MNWFEELRWRGMIQDCSDEKELAALGAGVGFYVGFDPTATSLHIGNLLQLNAAMHLARAGLKPIILFGGATGAIGDPSGKSEERPLLSREQIQTHIDGQKKKTVEILNRQEIDVEFVDNYDWTNELSLIEFLRDIGKHFTINYMLAKEVVKSRLGDAGISYTEFSYMLMQAHDFYHLYQEKNCRIQFGGSDQWGNITAGLELIRKKLGKPAHAFCLPLITDSNGKKFGKSEDGAVWLNPDLMSPYKFHQFWLNTEDAQSIDLLKKFTFLTKEEVVDLEKLTKEHPEKREAQRRLADEVCRMVHGEQSLDLARRSADVLFSGASLDGLDVKQLEEIFADVPSVEISKAELAECSMTDLLVSAKAAKSKGEARRLISGGGAYLNNKRIDDANLLLKDCPIKLDTVFIVRSGKKKYHLIRQT